MDPKPPARRSARAPASGERPKRAIFPVVGIGASAGGLEAFTQLLHDLPANTGLAFVLVQHLDPSHKSVLTELLARATSMPVIEASEGMTLAPDSVYVIPANMDMTTEGGVLRLAERPPSGPHLPIDLFLTSLARDCKSKAVAVILSGTAADGSAGVRAVKAEGGMTMAQEPATAKYSGMPESAIATGAVDLVLPIPLLARQLAVISRHPGSEPKREGETAPLFLPEDPALADVLALVRSATSVDFSHYKQSTVLRRINRRMTLHHLRSLEEYVEVLRQDRAELEALHQDLLIRVTSFFRQPHVFEALKEKFFPQIAGARAGEQVRFWVPGCSTGEEAYSLAIAWAEFVSERSVDKSSLQIFASDVNQQVIDKARRGIYPAGIASDVSQERLARFFTKVDAESQVEAGYQIAKGIRETCVFAKHDLTRDAPFSKLDLVSLRNVLIYLGPLLQRRIIPTLHFALRPGGFLLLGESESVGGFTDLFSLVDRKAKIHTRKESLAAVAPSSPPFTGQGSTAPRPTASPTEFDLSKEAERIILEEYAPVGVIVDADLSVRQFRGRTGAYLELGPGRSTYDLLRLAREGLSGDLRSALREARTSLVPLRRENVRMLRDDRVVAVGFNVIPIKSPTGEASFLVLFHDMPSSGEEGSDLGLRRMAETSDDASGRMADLERELGELREYTRAVLEDKESANEELRSANEELQSTNEELQSVNEELGTASEEVQSANEELRTLNDELCSVNDQLATVNSHFRDKNVELQQVNAALESRELELTGARDYARTVVDTVREPLLVIGGDYRVVSANPSFYRTFKTTATDTVGLSFFELEAGVWNVTGLREAMERTLQENADFEDLIVDRDFARLGRRTMLLSGRHIRGEEPGVGNILLAVDDITERTRAEASLRLTQLSVDRSADLVHWVAPNGRVLYASDSFCRRCGYSHEEVLGKTVFDLDPAMTPEKWSNHWQELKLQGSMTFEAVHLTKEGELFPVEVTVNYVESEGQEINVALARDITERKRIEEENARLYEEQRALFQLLQATLLDVPQKTGRIRFGHVYRSATQDAPVGGDFYDVFEIEGGRIALLIGDVSGHGVEAARVAMLAKDVIHAFAHRSSGPQTVLRQTNELLIEKKTPGFVTLFLGILEPVNGVLSYSSAGHPNALLKSKAGKVRFLEAASAPLGVFADHSWKQDQVELRKGELLLLYTDGAIEARRDGEFFGQEGLVKVLQEKPELSPERLPQALLDQVLAFSGGTLADDVAVLAVALGEEPSEAAGWRGEERRGEERRRRP